jgi:hypothetical protein
MKNGQLENLRSFVYAWNAITTCAVYRAAVNATEAT